MSLILSINAGSSSIKLTVVDTAQTYATLLDANITDIGQSTAQLVIKNARTEDTSSTSIIAPDHAEAAKLLVDWLAKQDLPGLITAIGHRIVHGGPKYSDPCIIDDEVLANLGALIPFDPEHMPMEIELIKTFQSLFPEAKHVACFDTAFHHNLPVVAQMLPIPLRYREQGLRRYGFHGLSYSFVLQQLRNIAGPDVATGRVIVAHLGNGVSLAAIRNGEPVDTSMGLTPASGVPMSTRAGDVDPGLVLFLSSSDAMNAKEFNDMMNFESGLLGMSEISSDMKTLLQHENEDLRAKNAIDLFCYQVKKSIGSLTATLGGLDTLVFTGGMGESAPTIRARICTDLAFLGIELDQNKNNQNTDIISDENSRVTVRIIDTNEGHMIVQNVEKVVSSL